ncbi:unnamed protein product [Rotaria magnacalcarata]
MKRLDEELKQIVSGIIYVRLRSIAEIIVNRKAESIEIGHRNKLIGLRADKCNRVPTQPMLDPVTNLSIYNLTYDEHTALINGLNHVYPSTRFDQSKFICNIEYFYSRLINFRTSYRHYESKHASEIVRHELTSLQLGVAAEVREAANSYRKVADSELKRTVMQNRKTFGILRSLAKNKDIIITRPDKGRGVVVMDRSDYMQKMNAILDDRSYFSLIDDDPTLVNENRLSHLLLDLKREGFISDSEYSLARPTGSRPARIYGLPKLHKQDCPLRPVMSATKTVSYGLGKMLTNRLNHLRTSRSLTSQKLDTTIYRKPTYTGLLIKWDSFVPLSYKKACIVSMVQRALAVCSTYALLSQEFQTIREIGQKNDYPSSFIDTRIGIGLGNYLKKLTTSNEAVAGCAKQRMYVEIPYTGTSSKMLKNKLSRISIKHRPDLEVCFFERPSPPVQIFFNVKDPIPKHLQANIIYSIQCSDCGDAYVGKTERQGIRRLWEHGAPMSLFSQKPFLPSEHTGPHDHPIQHQNQHHATNVTNEETKTTRKRKRTKTDPNTETKTIRRSSRILDQQNTTTREHEAITTASADKRVENAVTEPAIIISLSAPFQHEKQHGHRMNWAGFKILSTDANSFKLLIQESLVIKAYAPKLNKTTHSVPLIIFPEGLPKNILPSPYNHASKTSNNM